MTLYEDRVVKVADLIDNRCVIDGHNFVGCLIKGPAVLYLNECTVENCILGAPNRDAFLWIIPPTRPAVTGAVAVVRCGFHSCSFENIGVCGPPGIEDKFPEG